MSIPFRALPQERASPVAVGRWPKWGGICVGRGGDGLWVVCCLCRIVYCVVSCASCIGDKANIMWSLLVVCGSEVVVSYRGGDRNRTGS